MSKRFYIITRDLHLYLGLLLSPFVLVFAVSVFYLVHVSTAAQRQETAAGRVVSDVAVTEDLERLTGREQIDALRPVLDRLGVHGEISFIRRIVKEHRLVIPIPGRETTVDLNLATRTAAIAERETGISDALIHLHKMPGPHNVVIRGNSTYMRIWRALADVATYGLLFLTMSGLYLWAVLRAERRVGLALLSLGAVSFFGLIYALAY